MAVGLLSGVFVGLAVWGRGFLWGWPFGVGVGGLGLVLSACVRGLAGASGCFGWVFRVAVWGRGLVGVSGGRGGGVVVGGFCGVGRLESGSGGWAWCFPACVRGLAGASGCFGWVFRVAVAVGLLSGFFCGVGRLESGFLWGCCRGAGLVLSACVRGLAGASGCFGWPFGVGVFCGVAVAVGLLSGVWASAFLPVCGAWRGLVGVSGGRLGSGFFVGWPWRWGCRRGAGLVLSCLRAGLGGG